MDRSINWYLGYIFFIAVLITGCNSQSRQQPVESRYALSKEITESPIEITWEVLSNFEGESTFRAKLTFQNTGDKIFPAAGWTLYLNSVRDLDPKSFLPELEVKNINGGFFQMMPTDSFEPIQPGESWSIEYNSAPYAIKKTDRPQGFYFVFDDHIESVSGVDVKPFITEEQVNRSRGDRLDVPTPESTFRNNEYLTKLDYDHVGKITPTPKSTEYGNGVYTLSDGVNIFFREEFSGEAAYLQQVLDQKFGVGSSLNQLDGAWNGTGILLEKQESNPNGEEAYSLVISGDSVEMSSAGSAGIFYAIQSLRSLISNRNEENINLKTVEIDDYPQFEYRGMHLDVARNFQPKESVERLLDIMAMYKMNKFHFHLTDDEGWRLAIDPLPELVEVGGRRGHTLDDSNFLMPAYGSGPDPIPGHSFGSGWFSHDEYIEILKFANQHHIEVIPEIDVPGHARAAIKAMKARANRLESEGHMEEANMYRLDEEEDQSEYRSVQNYDDNVINICQESTFRFFGVVFDEIIAMHKEAGVPLTAIHLGGDEVPHGVWEKSPACKQYMADQGIEDIHELTNHFFEKLQSMLADRGLKMAGWEEIALHEDEEGGKSPNPEFVDSAIPYVWNSIWGAGTEEYGYMLANAGYKIVMANASNLYLDMAYNKSWQEPGFYWADMFNTKEIYSFIPFNLYRNAIQNGYGYPINPGRYDDAVQLTESGKENILGIQGQLWTETVNETGRMDYMIFPRLLAIAERAWVGDAPWSRINQPRQMWQARDKAWNEFANRIGQFELNRLDQNFEDIHYRLPTPGVIIENGMLKANSEFPGLEIRYEINGGIPDNESPVYEDPVELFNAESVSVSTFNKKGRPGRKISFQIVDSE